MKYLSFIFLALFATTVSAQRAPENMTTSAVISGSSQTISFRISWNSVVTVDSTMIAVFLSSDTIPVIFRKTTSPDTVTFSLPDDTTTYRFNLYSVRNGLVSQPANTNFYFNAEQYYVLTKLHIRPQNLTLSVGQTTQLCAFLEYNDGSVVIRERDAAVPTCITEYQKFAPEVRKSAGARQRNANTVCLQWRTTGGDIQRESCDTDTP